MTIIYTYFDGQFPDLHALANGPPPQGNLWKLLKAISTGQIPFPLPS